MPSIGDLFGKNSAIEQLLLWGVLNQVLQALGQPGLTALAQDVNARHPELALDPVTMATLLGRKLVGEDQALAEAAKNGTDTERFKLLATLHKVRLDPADAAEAVLRSYMTEDQATEQVGPQGYDPALFRVLTDLAGDAIGPEQAAEALRRKYIVKDGRGAASTSYEQAIAESRLHNKWGPILYELTRALLSPPDAASAVVRNFMDRGDAEALADLQGVDAETFGTMVDLSGDAPGPQQLAEALRRHLIERDGTGAASTSFMQGIAEGRLHDKWAPMIEGLSKLWPTPVDAIDALVKGQIPADQGKALYQLLGGDDQFYEWLLHSAGEGPSPLEAADLAYRGLIPWTGVGPEVTSYDQAVRESRYRDKWTEFYRQLAEYVPAPSEAITFAAHRAISQEQAIELFRKRAIPEAWIPAFVNEIDLTELSEYRGLTQTAVVGMYYSHLIDRQRATELLATLHVTDAAAGMLLDYADMQQVMDSLQRSVQRIAQLYTGRKISTATAREALVRLKIPSSSVEDIIETWELQAEASVVTLTTAQIADAWYYKVFTVAEAMEELEALGMTSYDAWAFLSIKNKAPLPGKPERDVAKPPGRVIAGVT